MIHSPLVDEPNVQNSFNLMSHSDNSVRQAVSDKNTERLFISNC